MTRKKKKKTFFTLLLIIYLSILGLYTCTYTVIILGKQQQNDNIPTASGLELLGFNDVKEKSSPDSVSGAAIVGNESGNKEGSHPRETKKYHDWTMSDISWHFDCEYDDRPIIPQSSWKMAREVYMSQQSSSSLSTPLVNYADGNGFSLPIEARKVPGKGRGVFTLSDIKKGELVWNSEKTARFATGKAFRDFIFALDERFICDALNFAYVQRLKYDHHDDKGSDQKMVLVDLDEGALCNGADNYFQENIGCRDGMGDGHDGGCQKNYFALRDIKAGEELICNYDDFQEGPGSWKELGL